MKRATMLFAVLSLALAACGGGDSAATTTTEASTTTTTTTQPETTTTTQPDTTTTTPELPGEPIDFGPREGDTLAVIGVAHDDVLNLRAAPGADQDIVAEIPNLYDDLTALGNTRDLGDAFWIEVDFEGTTGWVHMSFIGYIGVTDDATSHVVATLGDGPYAETMLDIGLIVAETFASDEPASNIVLTVSPTVGDLGEVTYDVIGIGDDAVRGFRVHVFGQPDDETFGLKSVEVTTLCGRGVNDEGLCL
ncbi:MAG TPA: SH3 domain-containing protein [Acidimicrobiia bacterium]|nr:SH3 domain-containing protein [Acidimicrobiia bacterium]